MLNLLNCIKITKLRTVNFYNSWYFLQCFESKVYLWFILSILRLYMDIYYLTLLSDPIQSEEVASHICLSMQKTFSNKRTAPSIYFHDYNFFLYFFVLLKQIFRSWKQHPLFFFFHLPVRSIFSFKGWQLATRVKLKCGHP